MEKIFGGVDFVEEGERDPGASKLESQAVLTHKVEETTTTHVEQVNEKETRAAAPPERSSV